MADKPSSYNLFSNVSKSRVEWIWYPYIPSGKITILQGDPGEGKSTLMMDIIASLTTGRELPDGRTLEPMNVIYQCSEDSLSDTIRPRLEIAGADLKKVGYLDEELFGITLDDEKFRTAIFDMKAKMLVIDPIQDYVGDADLSNASGMRKMLRRLNMWASQNNCAVVLVGHLTKRSNSKELYQGLGSIDLVAAARSVIKIEVDEDNPNLRVVKHIKSSLTRKGEQLSFGIDGEGRVVWTGLKVSSKEEKLRKRLEIEEGKTKQEQAAKSICELLKDGPKEAVIAEKILLEKGLSSRTIKLAKKMIGCLSLRKNKVWYWSLPTEERKPQALKELETNED